MPVSSKRIRTLSATGFTDITGEVAAILAESGITNGLCTVYVPHTTAGVTINEAADPSVRRDILTALDRLVPMEDGYTHAEGNSAAHIKAALVGASVSIPVSAGAMRLGTWQGIYLCEFDGPRSRTVHVQIIGDGGTS